MRISLRSEDEDRSVYSEDEDQSAYSEDEDQSAYSEDILFRLALLPPNLIFS